MTPVVRILLVANVAVFVLQLAYNPVVDYLGQFIPSLGVRQPWRLVTYMFLHGGFSHLFFNMLGLFFFGPRVEDRMRSGRFAVMYFLSGISGALLSWIVAPYPLVGASAGVFGVMLCFAHYWPQHQIYIWGLVPVSARGLVIFSTIMAVASGTFGVGGNIAHFAHLGGYAGAFLYLRWIERGRHEFKKRVEAVPAPAQKKLDDWKKIDLSAIHAINREEVQRLLEKISKDGIGALTAQERLFLSNFVPLGGQPSAPPS